MNFAEPANPVVLLGAGASKPAGVPLAGEMTLEILRLCRDRGDPDLSHALVAIIGAIIIGSAGDRDFDPYQVDIERVLDAATLLRDRQRLEFAPFVGAWHPALEELEAVKGTTIDTNRIVSDAMASARFRIDARQRPETIAQNLQGEIAEVCQRLLSGISHELSRRPDGSLFQKLVDYLTGLLIQLIWIPPDRELAYLHPLVDAGRRRLLTIASLNYDNSVEVTAAALRVGCETGVAEWSRNGSLPERVSNIELLKLHGSVKWWWAGGRDTNASMSDRQVEEREDSAIEKVARGDVVNWAVAGIGRQLAVIFGGRNKLTAEGPFLDLLSQFGTRLRTSAHLVVVGYSFRDAHVNHVIMRWLRGGAHRKVTIVERKGASPGQCALLRSFGNGRISFEPVGAEEGLQKIFAKPS